MLESVWTTSGSPRSNSILPVCASLASSQRTIPEIPQRRERNRLASRPRKSPVKARIRMCVSRLSIPAQPCGQDVAFDLELPPEQSDQGGGFGPDRNELGHGLAPLGDDDPVGIDPVEQGEALFLELGGGHLLHGHII